MPAGQCARPVMRGPRLLTCACLLPQMGGKSFESITEKENGPFRTPSQNFWPCFCWNDILFYKQLWAPTPHSCSHHSLLVHGFFVFSGNSLQNFEMLDKKLDPRTYAHLWQQRMRDVVGRGFRRGVLKCHPEDSGPPLPPPPPSMASKADVAKAPHSRYWQLVQQKLIFLVVRDS